MTLTEEEGKPKKSISPMTDLALNFSPNSAHFRFTRVISYQMREIVIFPPDVMGDSL